MIISHHFENNQHISKTASNESDVLTQVNNAFWVDIVNPTAEEAMLVGEVLWIELPEIWEVSEIEPSSRLYVMNDAIFMTTVLAPAWLGSGKTHNRGWSEQVLRNNNTNISNTLPDSLPILQPATFILTSERLITLRFADYQAFAAIEQRLNKEAKQIEQQTSGLLTPTLVFLMLVEAIIARLADSLEAVIRSTLEINSRVFEMSQKENSHAVSSQRRLLRRIGAENSVTSNLRESLDSLRRLLYFARANVGVHITTPQSFKDETDILINDILSLSDQAQFISDKLAFILDAALGVIAIEENEVVRRLSVIALTCSPPTVIAGIYGMNFQNMPELSWWWGYPMALLVIIMSGVIPYLLFRRR